MIVQVDDASAVARVPPPFPPNQQSSILNHQCQTNGAEGDRTPNLCIANTALSQLSYGPSVKPLCRPPVGGSSYLDSQVTQVGCENPSSRRFIKYLVARGENNPRPRTQIPQIFLDPGLAGGVTYCGWIGLWDCPATRGARGRRVLPGVLPDYPLSAGGSIRQRTGQSDCVVG